MEKTNRLLWLLGRPLFAGVPPIILILIDKIMKPIMNLSPNDLGILEGIALGFWLPLSFIWAIGGIFAENDPVKRGANVLRSIAVVVSAIICVSIFA